MNRTDGYFIGTAVAVAALAALWVQLIMGPEIAAGLVDTATAVAIIDNMIDYFVIVAAVGALTAAYRARSLLGGELARGLEIISIGLMAYVLTYWPSYRWAIEGNPAWLGLSSGFWDVLFGLMTPVSFGFIAYGFYTLWRVSR